MKADVSFFNGKRGYRMIYHDQLENGYKRNTPFLFRCMILRSLRCGVYSGALDVCMFNRIWLVNAINKRTTIIGMCINSIVRTRIRSILTCVRIKYQCIWIDRVLENFGMSWVPFIHTESKLDTNCGSFKDHTTVGRKSFCQF